jgi:Ca2+-binding EF-hand superfamily protein
LVSIEEFEVPSRGREHNRLVTADRDGDGNVSRSEMQDQIDERAEQAIERFELADLNDDDFLTEEEIKMAAFSSIDRNDDGYIDADELSAVRRSAKHRRPS